LFNLTISLLRLAPELHPPQLGDQQLQMLDLVVARQQLFVLGQDQCFQCRGIKLMEIGESAMSGNHHRESSRLLLQQNENVQGNKNYFAHTAICGA
jgi:hypothetical protein